jgi:hypothetical protein
MAASGSARLEKGFETIFAASRNFGLFLALAQRSKFK